MRKKILSKEVVILNHAFSAEKILTHPLFSGSFFMLVGSNLANFIAYVCHLVLGRLLSPALYGVLVATLSLVGLIMSLFSFFGLVIVKFVSSAKHEDVPSVLDWFNRKTIITAIIVTSFVYIVSPYLGNYIHITKNISFLFAPVLFFSILTFVYKAFLQGIVKFRDVVIISNTELLCRLVFGFIFIYLNMQVFGAILGLLLASIVAMLLSKYYLKLVGFEKKVVNDINWKKVLKYTLPVFLVSVTFTSLLTVDLIMVKHFFTSYIAGLYGSVSNLGKIIFYGTAPIGLVMFPLISKKKSNNEKFVNIFILSITIVVVLGLGVLFLYYLFPRLSINILYGEKYLEGSKYLLIMGLYYIFYSVANLTSSFLLSIDLIKPLFILPVFAFLQISLIFFFHQSIATVIGCSIASVSLLLAYLVIYFAYAKAKNGN